MILKPWTTCSCCCCFSYDDQYEPWKLNDRDLLWRFLVTKLSLFFWQKVMLNEQPSKIRMAKRHFVFSVSTKMMSTKFAFWFTLHILSLKTFGVNGSSSPLIVEDGVYSRVTVQIEPQPQPENCVEFLNQLEVGNKTKQILKKIIWQKTSGISVFYR